MSDNKTPTLAERGIVTRAELARQLKKKNATLRLWERDGMPVIKQGKTVLYDIDAVASWLKKKSRRAA